MYITLDILQKRGACQKSLDFFSKHYPDGVDMLYAIEKIHMPIHFLHWGYKWLDPGAEEVAAYYKKIKVINSNGIDESDNITNCEIVAHSSFVSDSYSVYNSKQITNSNYIVGSTYVDNSNNVCNSSFVDGSNRIFEGKNITNSTEVVTSTYVDSSYGVFRAKDVVNSHAIWHGNNLTNCLFCANCINLSNSMFCSDEEDGEYLLFNRPVDKMRFETIAKQYRKMAPIITLAEEWPNHYSTPHISMDYRKHIKDISDSFWDWVQTLPGYDSRILYSLTFNPQFLT